ncbi:hypothetical protein [Robiginitomaculum antarcticum]|uniref:hypothetical protein n=1 Tax=Robiginitomaculum antarcticum TaxID=437507 RepID=UPI00035EB5F3|nr:hypothetical protein [Robiginitomaculum antarcticum]
MKQIAIAIALGVSLAACATVEMAPVQSGSLMSQAEVQDRSEVKMSARKLSSVFSTEGWSRINPTNKAQSAVNILVRGLKKTGEVVDPVRNYLSRRSEEQMIVEDIDRANDYVTMTNDTAKLFLLNNPSATDIVSELSDLETALLSARQAEAVFRDALKTQSLPLDHESMMSLTRSVDSLRDTTDIFGSRLRGGSPKTS